MKSIFVNPSENRFRAGWRIFFFILAFAISVNAIYLGITAIMGGAPARGLGREFLMFGIIASVITLILKPARRFLDKKSVVSLGLRFDSLALKDLLFGWLLSGLIAAIFFGILWLLGDLQINDVRSLDVVLLPLFGYFVIHLLVGYWEELFFRGYLFDNFKDGLGLSWAIVVSCMLYGVAHMANPNASIISSAIIILFGLMRLYGLLSTEQMWLSMGMHVGWNFFQGPIFGFAASGQQTIHLIDHTTSGSIWITGGDFGPEGSIITIPLVFISMGVMYWWSKRFKRQRTSCYYNPRSERPG